MSSSKVLAIAALLALVCTVSGQAQYDYQKKNYVPPQPTGATTCIKGTSGNTPALCPVDKGVPLTDEGKSGSTTCVTGVDGAFLNKNVEGVLSLMYAVPTAVPWCTTNSQCGTNPGVICATQGPAGSGNMCFPLAPSTCPFTGDTVNSTTIAAAGRRLMMI